jgi:hypothetical protein
MPITLLPVAQQLELLVQFVERGGDRFGHGALGRGRRV